MMRKHSYILLTGLLILSSCIKEQFDKNKLAGYLNFTPGVAVPIGYAHMSLDKYLNDTNLNTGFFIDNKGLITLVYRDKVLSLQASDFFKFPDISVSGDIPTSNPIDLQNLPSNPFVIPDTIDLPLNVSASDAEIDSLVLNSANLSIEIDNPNELNGTISILFPGVTQNGIQYQLQKSLRTGREVYPADLAGYSLSLTKKNGQKNLLRVIVILSLTQGTGIVQPGTLLGLKFGLNNIHFREFFGYAGKISLDIENGSFPLNFYQGLLDGNFYFADPVLKINFLNSFGLPVKIFFTDFHAELKKGGYMFLRSAQIPSEGNPTIIRYPSIAGNIETTSIVLDGKNSNIDTLLSALPKDIIFGLGDTINPEGYANNNYVLDSSQLEVNVQIELPLNGYADFLLMEDTLNFDFARFVYKDPKEVNKLFFRINVTNGFPVAISPQIYFTDAGFNRLDSLFSVDSTLIKSADIDADGNVTKPSYNSITVPFARDRIAKIENATQIIARGRIRTKDSPGKNVRFYKSNNAEKKYIVDFNLGVIVQLQVNTGF